MAQERTSLQQMDRVRQLRAEADNKATALIKEVASYENEVIKVCNASRAQIDSVIAGQGKQVMVVQLTPIDAMSMHIDSASVGFSGSLTISFAAAKRLARWIDKHLGE